MVKVNRLFNLTLLYCNIVKFVISLMLYSYGVKNCFKMIAASDYLIETIFGILLATTDYSLIICVIYMFFRTVREKKMQRIKNLSRILEVIFIQSPKEENFYEHLNDSQRSRRKSSDSVPDYMMYST